LLLPEISGAFFPPLLRGIEAAARETGFDLLIHATEDRFLGPGQRRPLGEHNTDGLLIFTDSLAEEEILRIHALGLPVVLMHQTLPEAPIPVITVENKNGAAQIVSHLIEVHGRRRIVFLRGPERQEDSAWRERGYREALESHGVGFDESLISYGGFDRETGAGAVRELLARGQRFDAVFGGDDEAALGALSALQTAGVRVPEEVSVVGFDDLPFAPFVHPALTTVRAPTEQVGREAVRQLIHLMRGETAELLTLLPTQVILRRSCGCS
jgi:DNA-binding LacI/PurR family transcriptional regulator